ncbi:MAG: hypothetical protein E6G39_09085 [Actinobacteria bacterium]|nr:MAG: hypothetical protein E6G39_09085 [Actinomycetota bacterium]
MHQPVLAHRLSYIENDPLAAPRELAASYGLIAEFATRNARGVLVYEQDPVGHESPLRFTC